MQKLELIGAKAVLSGNLSTCNQTQIPQKNIQKRVVQKLIKTIYNEDKKQSHTIPP